MADSVQWLSQSDHSICISVLVEFYLIELRPCPQQAGEICMKNPTITGQFGFVFEENSVREITWLSWRHRSGKPSFSKCFLFTLKRKASVFKFFRFEERFWKAVWTVYLTVEIKTDHNIKWDHFDILASDPGKLRLWRPCLFTSCNQHWMSMFLSKTSLLCHFTAISVWSLYSWKCVLASMRNFKFIKCMFFRWLSPLFVLYF